MSVNLDQSKFPSVCTRVSTYPQLVKGGLYSNGQDVRKLIYVPEKMDSKNGDVQWQGKQHDGSGGAFCSAKGFRSWVNRKPVDLPDLVYSNAVSVEGGLKSHLVPIYCIWDTNGGAWCSTDGDHVAVVLGLLRVGGTLVYTSISMEEVEAWTLGVQSALSVVTSMARRRSLWGDSLPVHT